MTTWLLIAGGFVAGFLTCFGLVAFVIWGVEDLTDLEKNEEAAR